MQKKPNSDLSILKDPLTFPYWANGLIYCFETYLCQGPTNLTSFRVIKNVVYPKIKMAAMTKFHHPHNKGACTLTENSTTVHWTG